MAARGWRAATDVTSNDPNQIPELQVYAFNGTSDTTYGGAWIALQNQGTSTNSSVPISVATLVGTHNVRLYVPAGATVYADMQIPFPAAFGIRPGPDALRHPQIPTDPVRSAAGASIRAWLPAGHGSGTGVAVSIRSLTMRE